MMACGGTEEISYCFSGLLFSGSWLGVCQPKLFVYMSPADNLATLHKNGEVYL